jgi:hypothetical protein
MIVYVDGEPRDIYTYTEIHRVIKIGRVHRIGGPAVIWPHGAKEWRVNGKLHREDGPAVDFGDGRNEWYLNGERYTFNEFLTKLPVEDAIMVKLTWG